MSRACPAFRFLPLRAAGGACLLALFLGLLAWTGPGLGLWRMPGIRVAGVSVPQRGPIRAVLARHARVWNEQSLSLEIGHRVFQPSRAELGFRLRVEDAEHAIREVARAANPILGVRALWIGWFGRGHALAWRPRVHDPGALARYLEQLRSDIDRLPIPGSYAPDGATIEGLPGEALDTRAARREIERAVARGDAALEIATIVTPPPRVYRRYERPADETTVLLTSQETRFRPGTGRAINIELAARKLDGTMLLPGASLSFNERVGKREAARGFAPALELMNGELTQGIGGGVCQVAGTLHAAAFYAGLSVEEYHAHSRLSRLAYLQPGLDAMVAWPDHVRELRDTKDMRLRNPYPYPVLIRTAVIHSGNLSLLRVQLFGAAKPYRVDFEFKVLERVPAGEVRRPDTALRLGETRVQQEAFEGLVIARRRTIYTPLRKIDEETRVAYPPTPRIVRVGG